MVKRIMITGPESTGKSWLAQKLAAHYHTRWVPERARTYLAEINRPYQEQDLLQIAKEQLELENSMTASANQLLFCDTGMLVLKIWSEHSYGRCHPFILDQLKQREYALHLLPDIDMPWEPDPQREHPHLRPYFFQLYQNELQKAGKKFTIIRGVGDQRLQEAIKMVDPLVLKN